MRYCIAGIHFELDVCYQLESCWNMFKDLDGLTPADIFCSPMKILEINRDIEFAECAGMNKVFLSSGSFAMSDNAFHNVYISECNSNVLSIFLAYLFCTHAARREMLKIHCSVIEECGKGIIFLGPSGIGKTTQAELWEKYRGASIINGDVGFVQRTKEGYLAWGTPWHGSSPYCINTSVPLKALVVLKQAPVNKLRELYGFEKVAEVSGSIMYPNWMPDGRELCAETLNHLLSDLPVYRLDNRADLEAVELLEKELNYII